MVKGGLDRLADRLSETRKHWSPSGGSEGFYRNGMARRRALPDEPKGGERLGTCHRTRLASRSALEWSRRERDVANEHRTDSELWAAAQAAVDNSGIPVFPAAVESAARVEWPDHDPEGFIELGVKLKVPLLYVEKVAADGELLFGSVEWTIDDVTHVWEVARLVEEAGDDDSNRNNPQGGYSGFSSEPGLVAAVTKSELFRQAKNADDLLAAVQALHPGLPERVQNVLLERCGYAARPDLVSLFAQRAITDARFQAPQARKRSAEVVAEICEDYRNYPGFPSMVRRAAREAEHLYGPTMAREAHTLRATEGGR